MKLCKNLSKNWKILSLCILLAFLGCNRQEESAQLFSGDKIPDEEADSLYVVVTEKDKLDYEMTATKMRKFYDMKQTLADTVFVTFYNSDGSVKTTLSCDRAEVDDAENIIICQGNVVVISENATMKAPEAILNRNTEQIFARNGVTLIRNENTLYGEEMISDMRLEVAEFRKVSAEGTLKDEEIDW